MSDELLKVVLASLTIIGSIFGLIRWVLGFYFKSQQDLETTRKSTHALIINGIKTDVSQIKNDLIMMGADIEAQWEQIKSELSGHNSRLEKQKDILEKFVKLVAVNAKNQEEKLAKIEGHIGNFGKVIVKD